MARAVERKSVRIFRPMVFNLHCIKPPFLNAKGDPQKGSPCLCYLLLVCVFILMVIGGVISITGII